MKSFDQTHLILLTVTVAFVAATMWLTSKLPRKGQTWLFAAGALLCAGGIFWRYAMSMSFSPPNSHLSWETLTIQMLQVCSFNLILVILMLVPRLELARQYSFFFSMFAAATALVSLPKSWEALDWYAPTILNSWLNHVFAIALPLWMLAARRLKPQKKYILPVAGCVVGYFVIVYGCTEWLHAVGRLPEDENILDTAGQKGTGKWTGIAALDEGVPLTLIGEAVFARCLSAMKADRVVAAKAYGRKIPEFKGDKAAFVEAIRQALYASKIVSYAQGYTLMRTAAKTYGWNLNYGGIALMWRGGCIIRSVFLGKIKEAYDKNPELSNLLLDPYFKETIEKLVPAWREVASAALAYGIPAPTMTSALSYFDGYTTERLPANLLQAQRDYFGAHTYERLDKPRGEFFHTNWTGHGGNTSAATYNA